MKISYNWLRALYPTSLTPERVSEILTNTGLEVEGVEAFESIEGGLKGLVIGEVMEKWKHPNADRLHVTRVNVGERDLLQIVCGASNVDVGQKVVVAMVGAKLYPNEGDSFEIKKGKIRGEVSEGMICAEDEIGLGDAHDGIMVLDPSAIPGTAAADYFSIYHDHTIEIGLTPNRTDAMSHFGVARDLRAAIAHAEELIDLKPDELMLPSTVGFHVTEHSMDIDVEVRSPEACIRYAGVCLKGASVSDSPEWLQNKLKAIGLSPINNVVDVTNYVLHEIGQPLHAFDAAKIKGNKVVVRLAKASEKFVTLDDRERELRAEDLLICDAQDGMCIAGVFGGAHSGITASTTDIFLESAVFDPVYIRKTSRHHLLHTDAAYRFERGVDPDMTIYALKRAAQMICEIAGAHVASDVTDIYPRPMAAAEIALDLKRMNGLMGKDLNRDRITSILRDLDFTITQEEDHQLLVLAPLYRRDVTREADVVEEVLRIYGYNSIEMPQRLHSTLSFAPKPDPEKIMHKVADTLVSRGFQEIMNNSLTRTAYSELLASEEFSSQTAIPVLNPLSSDLGQMRQSLLFQGLETVSRNRNFRKTDLRLFEFGRVYHKIDTTYREAPKLSIWVSGNVAVENWNTSQQKVDFSAIHGAVDTVLSRLGLSADTSQTTSDAIFFESGIELHIKGAPIVMMGAVSKKLLKSFDIDTEVYYAEFDWKRLVKLAGAHVLSYHELPKYPAVRRDLSMLLNREINFATIRDLAFRTERKLLKQVGLFDVYEGKNIAEGKKSYAVSFILMDDQATLTDKKIDKTMQRIQQVLEQELGAELRS